MDTIEPKDVKPGDEVYVIYNNPHTPTVSNIVPAEVVEHPKDPNRTALFLHETFHTIEDGDALFSSEDSASKAYEEMYEGISVDDR